MKILLIDACGAIGSVALADTGPVPAILANATLPARTASERLVAAIRDLTARVGIGLESLGAIAVVAGPGSFTGVRVGLSAAKGLCEALNLPLVSISRLAVLAHLAGAPSGTPVFALLDAGRAEFYCGEYMDGKCIYESLRTREELIAALSFASGAEDDAARHPLVVACEPAVVAALTALSPRLVGEPSAGAALPFALGRIQQNAFADVATLDANYLRRTDAEIFAKSGSRAAAVLHPTGTPIR